MKPRRLGLGLVTVSALVAVLVVGSRGQVFSFAAFAARDVAGLASSSPGGNTEPPEVIGRVWGNESKPLEVLAAGDIAQCRFGDWLHQTLRNVAYSVGMPLHADPGGDGARLTAALAGRHPDAAILAVGDLAYYDGSPANFGLCFDRFWGRLKPRVLPAPGNHEYNSRDAYGYFEEWGPRAGPERRGYYAVERGNWLLLSLNSEVAANPGSDQADWLDGVLVQSDATCILAFFHKPAYSLQARPDSQNARLLFERLSRAGAALVVNGHNHFYERSLPLAADGTRAAGGLVTFVVGTGGASPTSPIRPVESTATSIFGVYGLLRLELLDGSYRWQFIDAKTDAVLDSGESACTRPRLSARK